MLLSHQVFGVQLYILDPISAGGLNGAAFPAAWVVKADNEDSEKITMRLHTRKITTVVTYVPKFMMQKTLAIEVNLPYLTVHEDFVGKDIELVRPVIAEAWAPENPRPLADAVVEGSAANAALTFKRSDAWKKSCRHLFA